MIQDVVYEYVKSKPKKPVHLREVVRALGLKNQEAKEALEGLVAAGKLIKTRRKTYGLPEKMDLVVGPVQVHPDGYGFVLVEDGEDLFIPPARMGGAWPMDKVVARKLPRKDRGRVSGEVIRILERHRKTLVGTLVFSRGYAILLPDDRRYQKLLLSPEGLEGLQEGARIVVEIRYPEESGETEPFGVFKEYLGQGHTPETELKAVIHNFGLRDEFPEEVLAEARKIRKRIPSQTLRKRRDFREENVFTIDGADAKDFDDAIHIRRLSKNRWQVGVHIADVAHYVREGSAIDREAYARGTSVYLPGRVLPMLPEKLSNGVCSLVPGEDRLVLSVIFVLDEKARVLDYEFAEGVICSRARLTYDQVEDFLHGGRLPPEARELEPDVKALHALTRKLKEQRQQKGSLDFQTMEVKVDVDDDGNLHLIPVAEPEARSLIEELMLLANKTVAAHLDDREIPALYRVHDDPVADKYKALVEALNRLGYDLPMGGPEQKSMQRVLEKARERPEGPAVSMLLLRSMSLARYAPENLGHFGLAFEDYLHFTSPIRRYPDLVVHRVLKDLLRGKLGPRKRASLAERFPEMAEHVSERERAAEKAERDLTKYYQTKWAEEHLGEVFRGTVSGVTNFGLFVALENGVEGLLSLSELEDDYYEFRPEALELVGRHTGKTWRLGDGVWVRIERATPSLRQIDFGIEEEPVSSNKKGEQREKDGSKKSRKRVLAGPPEEKQRRERPVKLTANKVYFHEWSGEKEEDGSQSESEEKKKKSRRRKH